MVFKVKNKIKETSTKIFLQKKVVDKINATPERECWICDQFANNIRKTDGKYYVLKKDIIYDEGIKEHIKQLE
jgi:hypothetical protein